MPVFLGLDCGGSSSRALALNEASSRVFEGQSGPANVATTPRDQIEVNLRKATGGCPAPDYVCGCFAGLLTPEDHQTAFSLLSDFFPTALVRAEPDYAAAHASCPPGTDICVISGTGSLICSRGPDGLRKSGGRGYILGDRGSAFQYGRALFTEFLDGRRSEAATQAVLTIFGDDAGQERRTPNAERDHANRLIAFLYRSGSPASRLARLAGAFAVDARNGLPYATRFLKEESRALANEVAKHQQLNLPGSKSLSICLCGGLWKSGSIYRVSFEEALREILPKIHLRFEKPQISPVGGAVILAKELSHE